MAAELADFIMTQQPLSYGKAAIYPFSSLLTKKLTFETRFGDDVEMFRKGPNGTILVPRALCPIGANDNRSDGKVVLFPNKPKPRPHQQQLFNEVEEFLKEGLSGLVEAYTGFGKTVVGYLAAYVCQRKTLVVTTKEDIFNKWVADAPKFLGISEDEVGIVRGDKCHVIGTKFVVALIQTMSKTEKYPEDIWDDFGLIIFDECHRVPADSFVNVAFMTPAKIRLGLSANTQRSDGKDLLLHAHIGPLRAQTDFQLMVPKILRYHTGWEVPLVRRRFNLPDGTTEVKLVKLPHTAGKTAHIEKIIAADPDRNAMVADTILRVFGKGRKNIIFSTQLEHLRALQRLCIDMGVPGKHTGLYQAARNKTERAEQEKIKVRPVLFTTYVMAGEGTDFPWLDTCTLAMPRANVEQPVGRIRREYEDKSPPTVIDFIDGDSPVFAGYASRRKSWYTSIGAPVIDMD